MDEKLNVNTIVENVRHIDKIQKEIVINNVTSCITCETSLITQANNTVPVAFYMCSGTIFGALTAPDAENTTLFRIECLRDSRFVTLRLITASGGTLTCTNQTCLLDLNCVAAMQCFTPINCTDCEGWFHPFFYKKAK